MGKHSAPRATMPGTQVLVAGAVGVPVVFLTGLSASAAAASAVSTSTATETTVFVTLTNARYLPPSGDDLTRLRGCEASGRYETNTGNGFYGAYQFDAQTWRGLGLAGLPHQASPSTQDSAAAMLEQQRGWQPWPACSQMLSLVPRRSHGLSTAQVLGTTVPTTPAVSITPAAQEVPAASAPKSTFAAPTFAQALTLSSSTTYRSDVRLWQERMSQRGWRITVDGYFGPQSAAVARAFTTEKGIVEGLAGEIGAQGWNAAWMLPVAQSGP